MHPFFFGPNIWQRWTLIHQNLGQNWLHIFLLKIRECPYYFLFIYWSYFAVDTPWTLCLLMDFVWSKNVMFGPPMDYIWSKYFIFEVPWDYMWSKYFMFGLTLDVMWSKKLIFRLLMDLTWLRFGLQMDFSWCKNVIFGLPIDYIWPKYFFVFGLLMDFMWSKYLNFWWILCGPQICYLDF